MIGVAKAAEQEKDAYHPEDRSDASGGSIGIHPWVELCCIITENRKEMIQTDRALLRVLSSVEALLSMVAGVPRLSREVVVRKNVRLGLGSCTSSSKSPDHNRSHDEFFAKMKSFISGLTTAANLWKVLKVCKYPN